MKTELFDFTLPDELIAVEPAHPRDAARLLVGDHGRLQDLTVRELPKLLRAGDVMVFNDTRVIPARLFGVRGQAKIEVLLHKKLLRRDGEYWQCFAKPAKKLKLGDAVSFSPIFCAAVRDKLPSGEVVLQFEGEGKFHDMLQRHGHMPLPPYIAREAKAEDSSNYQTVYAREQGSVAAPTAGLHFTQELLAAIDAAGAIRAHVTLHVGGGTFLPVKAEDTTDHVMHSEWAELSAKTAEQINNAKAEGRRIIAVGTTSLRTLESAALKQGMVAPFKDETSIFITPGYRFKIVDAMLTNFHLPRSTLFMLVSAFYGMEEAKRLYNHAITNSYRFYSYGDASFLSKNIN